MELYQIRYFVSLSRVLNFTRAAELCNVTQPALTKAVRKLEAELGGDLLHRERQFTQLTELGKLVLPMFETIADAAEKVRGNARTFNQGGKALRLGLATSVSASLVSRVIAEVASAVPELQVEVIEVRPPVVAALLLDGEIAAAVAGDFVEVPERIDQWKLFEEDYAVLMPVGHRLSSLDPIPVNLLEHEVWLDHSDGEILERFWRLHFGDASPSILHRGSNHDAVMHLAAAGLGIVLAPAHAQHPGTMVRRRIDPPSLRHEVRLFAVSGRPRSPTLETFLKTALRHDWKLCAGDLVADDVTG